MGYFLMVFLMAFLLLDYAVIYSDATKKFIIGRWDQGLGV
ncbi:hypothetical protein BofuT4_uP107810.1 [Botrytis cinerea T4]|uniref:Uncharacterized protein n=1 Tax=Botryotinia fuckeliana (strain T4) TaxID=999810 RepID=G2Y6Z5_BOTF4|nr:hypothetical protein BofuT4_uP107810.1 [Botrytis cinerea T4]